LYEKLSPKKVRPLFDKSAKNSASNFPDPTQFYSTIIVFCGRNFGPLAHCSAFRRPVQSASECAVAAQQQTYAMTKKPVLGV
jgi:hypothetical protein